MNSIKSNINKILIIGASGFLGSYIYYCLKNHYKVTGTYYSKANNELQFLDLTNQKQIHNLLNRTEFDLIIICGGITRPDECESNKELAYLINVESIDYITKITKAKLIYFSTHYVFDGKKSEYDEFDKPNPINYYGLTKFYAENLILKNNIVIRVPFIYGANVHNDDFLNSLKYNEIFKPIDLFCSTILLNDIYKYLPYFFNAVPGIYHLSSGSKISRYDFTKLALEILKIPSILIGIESNNSNQKVVRPLNSTLISKKIFFKLSNEMDGLESIYNQLKSEGL